MATERRNTHPSGYEDLVRPINELLNQGKLWKWVPSGLNSRIVASAIREGRIDKNHYEEITIAADWTRRAFRSIGIELRHRRTEAFQRSLGLCPLQCPRPTLRRWRISFRRHQRGEFQLRRIERYGERSSSIELTILYTSSRGSAEGPLRTIWGPSLTLTRRQLTIAQSTKRCGVQQSSNAKLALSDTSDGAIADYDNLRFLGLTSHNSPWHDSILGITKSCVRRCSGVLSSKPYDSPLNSIQRVSSKLLQSWVCTFGDYLESATTTVRTTQSAEVAEGIHNRGIQKRTGDYGCRGYSPTTAVRLRISIHKRRSNYYRWVSKSTLDDYLGAIADYEVAIKLNTSGKPTRMQDTRWATDLGVATTTVRLNSIHISPGYNILEMRNLRVRIWGPSLYDRVIDIYPRDSELLQSRECKTSASGTFSWLLLLRNHLHLSRSRSGITTIVDLQA